MVCRQFNSLLKKKRVFIYYFDGISEARASSIGNRKFCCVFLLVQPNLRMYYIILQEPNTSYEVFGPPGLRDSSVLDLVSCERKAECFGNSSFQNSLISFIVPFFPPNSAGKMSSPTSWRKMSMFDIKTLQKISCHFEYFLGVLTTQRSQYFPVFLIQRWPNHADNPLQQSWQVDDEQHGIVYEYLVVHGVSILWTIH